MTDSTDILGRPPIYRDDAVISPPYSAFNAEWAFATAPQQTSKAKAARRGRTKTTFVTRGTPTEVTGPKCYGRDSVTLSAAPWEHPEE